MATNYSKYINSTGTHYISNSGSDEHGSLHSGQAGDQTGKEWRLRSWYDRPWTCVLRYPDPTVRQKIAEFGIDAALNDKVGYDQWQRYTYWDALVKAGYRPANVATPCEADCTAGVNGNVKAVGHLLGIAKLANLAKDIRSGNMRARYKAAGFEVLTEKKYLQSGDYLLPGDILLYDNHHAATNITKGKRVAETAAPEGLRRGDKGEAVAAMQRALLVWRASMLPKYGADGDFGAETEAALRAFQASNGLPVTGIYDAATEKALKAVKGAVRTVDVTGSAVNVRSAPNTSARILGVVHRGDRLPFQGEENGVWLLVEYKGQNAWISGKFAEIVG